MGYINFEVEVEDGNVSSDEELTFSDNENNFIDDSNEECSQPPSFYRFVNQTSDPVEAVNDDDGSQFDRRYLQTEMFFSIDTEHVEFEEFDDAKKCAEKFLKSLLSQDGDIKNSFFDAILYSFLFKLSEDNKVLKESGEEFFDKFSKEKDSLQLDDSLNSFFKKCHLVNDLLETKGLFLRVYERHGKFQYVIKKVYRAKIILCEIFYHVSFKSLIDMKYLLNFLL